MVAMFTEEDGTSSVAAAASSSPPLQVFSMMPPLPTTNSSYPWLKDLKPEERGLYLIHLLLTCANHVTSGSLHCANSALDHLSHLSSPHGDTMQRIAAYFTEALATRILKSSWPGLYNALNSTRTANSSDEETARVKRLFSEMFPVLNVSYLLANRAILEAMDGERVVHVIDLDASEPAQWVALIQAFNSRPEGPPHLRITGVNQHKEVLDHMAHRLTEEAEKLDIPFQFNPVVCTRLECLDIDQLRVKTGEALAICSVLQLHRFLASDDDDDVDEFLIRRKHNNNPPQGRDFQRVSDQISASDQFVADNNITSSNYYSLPLSSDKKMMNRFLHAMWSLSPKLMVVTEQDSDHNGSTLMERLLESLYTYAALFDCLESKAPRSSKERIRVEKTLFGEEIKNIIACEGCERTERHEKLEKWSKRLDSAGFGSVPLSYYGMLQARRLLESYGCEGYRIKEEKGCAVICWQDRPLYSVSAWRCRK